MVKISRLSPPHNFIAILAKCRGGLYALPIAGAGGNKPLPYTCPHARAVLFFLSTWFLVSFGFAAPSIVAPRMDVEPAIDGAFEESLRAQPFQASEFQTANTGKAAPQKTKVLAACTEDGLYLWFDVADADVASRARERDADVWDDDCVEIFLDPANRKNNAYHFIVNASGSVYDAKEMKPAWNGAWRAVARKTAEGWGAEIFVPFATLGCGAPTPGARWNIKLAREDYGTKDKTPVISSWTFVGNALEDPSAFGDLIFGGANLAANPSFEEDSPESGFPKQGAMGWKPSEQSGLKTPDRFFVRDGAAHTGRQTAVMKLEGDYCQVYTGVPVQPEHTYRASIWVNAAAADKNTGIEFYVDPQKSAKGVAGEGWQRLSILHRTDAKQDRLHFALTAYHGRGELLVDDFSVEEAPSVSEDNLVCLTGNGSSELAGPKREANGRYTYRDFNSLDDYFPTGAKDGTGTEGNRVEGWVDFKQGVLTDGKPTRAVWLNWSVGAGKEVVFDLLKDHVVEQIDLDSVSASLTEISVFARRDRDEEDTLVWRQNSLRDLGGKSMGYTEIPNLSTPARYLRVRLTGDSSGSGDIGLSEVRIWSDQKKDPKAVNLSPYRVNHGKMTVSKANPKPPFIAARSDYDIFPSPHKLVPVKGVFQTTNAWLVSTSVNLSPVQQSSVEHYLNRLGDFYGLSWKKATALAETPKGLAVMTVNADKSDLSCVPKTLRPQGYFLRVHPADGILLAAVDDTGLAYGLQTLSQLACVSNNHLSVPGVEIEDWPDWPLRMFCNDYAYTTPSGRRLLNALSWLKMNHTMVMGLEPNAAAAVPDIAKRGMKFMPILLAQAGTAWAQNIPGGIELNPGETLNDLPNRSRANPCPSNPQVRKTVTETLQKLATDFKYNSEYVNVAMDETYQEYNGSRWNVCALCAARKMDGGQLMAEWLQFIYDEMAKVGKKPFMLDSMYSTDYKKMKEAFERIPRDIPIGVWHKEVAPGLLKLGYKLVLYGDKEVHERKEHPWHGVFVSDDGGLNLGRVVGWAEYAWSPKKLAIGSPEFYRQMERAYELVAQDQLGLLSPARAAAPADFVPISLQSLVNRSHADAEPGDPPAEARAGGKGWFDLGSNQDLRHLTTGRQQFGGVPYEILDPKAGETHSVIMIQPHGFASGKLPCHVEIPVNQKLGALEFLHTAEAKPHASYVLKDYLLGYYEIHYANEPSATSGAAQASQYLALPIRYNESILEWNNPIGKGRQTYVGTEPVMLRGKVAWHGDAGDGSPVSLVSSEWINPYPDCTIAKVIFRTPFRNNGIRLVLFALTGLPAPKQAGIKPLACGRAKDAPTVALRSAANRLLDWPDDSALGKPVDLRGGARLDDKTYRAPDGSTISVDRIYNLGENTNWRTYIRHPELVTWKGNQNWEFHDDPSVITVRYSRPHKLSAIVLSGNFTKAEFWASEGRMDYAVEVQPPGGQEWTMVGKGADYVADLEGPRVTQFEPREVQSFRVRITPKERFVGLSFLQGYERP
ncbi:MAG: hypothetical protein HY360_06905 [Verrucomicrobia bacterium]|nr:hypothetical protein [Verrucomicrobiota bacterium]